MRHNIITTGVHTHNKLKQTAQRMGTKNVNSWPVMITLLALKWFHYSPIKSVQLQGKNDDSWKEWYHCPVLSCRVTRSSSSWKYVSAPSVHRATLSSPPVKKSGCWQAELWSISSYISQIGKILWVRLQLLFIKALKLKYVSSRNQYKPLCPSYPCLVPPSIG